MDLAALLIVAGILMAVVSLIGLAVSSVQAPEQRPNNEAMPVQAETRVMCPDTNIPLRIRIGANGRIKVLSCERFPGGTVTCRQQCLQSITEKASTLSAF